MKHLSKALIILSAAGILILSACSKDTVQNDKVYKTEGNSTVSQIVDGAPTGKNQTTDEKSNTPKLDNEGIISLKETNDLVKKASGTWVNQEWISNLKKTKSIIKSVCAMPMLYVSNGETGAFQLEGPTDDFHQGGAYDTATNDMYKVTDMETSNTFFKVKLNRESNIDVIKENKKDDPFILISNNVDKLEYYYGDIKRSFIKMSGSLDNYVNKIILAGNYVDEKGSNYTFTDDGIAIWPNSKDKYEIDFNAIYSQLDNVSIGDISSGKYTQYNYEIIANQLYLYKTTTKEDTDFLQREKTPFLVLKKVG